MIEAIINTTDAITKTLPPSVSLNINTIIMVIIGGMVGIIGFFIKRTLNETKESIAKLEAKKIDSSVCLLKEELNQKIFGTIHDNIQEIKEGQKEVKESVNDLGETLTNIRIFLSKGKWDGITERRANSRGAIN